LNYDPFLRLSPTGFSTTRMSYSETERPVVANIVALAFRKLINGSFSTVDFKQLPRIPVFDAERIYLFLSAFFNHLTPVVRLTRRRNAVRLALFTKAYIAYREFIYDLYGTLHCDVDHLLSIAPSANQNRDERK
jgi:hypothetical protein